MVKWFLPLVFTPLPSLLFGLSHGAISYRLAAPSFFVGGVDFATVFAAIAKAPRCGGGVLDEVW